MSKDSTRKSFVFSVEAADRLERLTKTCRLDSATNTIRLALTVLEELVDVIQKGGVIVIRDGSGRERFYHPLLEPNPDVVVPTEWNKPQRGKDEDPYEGGTIITKPAA